MSEKIPQEVLALELAAWYLEEAKKATEIIAQQKLRFDYCIKMQQTLEAIASEIKAAKK